MKVLLIGVGAAGNKAVLTVANTNDEIDMDDIVLINSTTKDIPTEYNGYKIILSPDDAGCGKERSAAKDYTVTAIQSGKFDKLVEIAENYDAICIVTSLEGGTGSGASPLIAKFSNSVIGKNTHLFGFTGFEEDPRGLQNTIEFFQDIDEDIMVQCICNNLFLKSRDGKFKAEKLANLELARRIKTIDGGMLVASEQNIDSTDLYKVVNTFGYATTGYEQIREPFNSVDDFNKICEKMIYENKGLKNTEAGQQRMAVIMNINPVSEDYIDTNYTVLKKAFGTPYECFTHKQYDPNEEEFIAFISSGQKLPLEEVKAIYDRYMSISSSVVQNASDTFHSEVSGFNLSGVAKFDMGRPKQKNSVSRDDFLKGLQTKPTNKKE